MLAIIQSTIKTISFTAYASAKKGLLLIVRYAAIKLVETDTVLTIKFVVLKFLSVK